MNIEDKVDEARDGFTRQALSNERSDPMPRLVT